MDWLPQAYRPDAFSSDDDAARDVRIRQADGSLRLEGNLTYEGLRYTVESVVPRPDIAVLATDEDGELSPAFAFAAEEQDVPQPVVAPARPEPPEVEKYLDVPEDLDEGIAVLAREQTANLTTNYEIGLALESWFHSGAFAYSTNVDPGHAANDLAAWLLYPDQAPDYRIGYCENFATAMAVMARTLDVPSRVVLGFTPGEATEQENVVVVRDRNAHAWVELWMPTQGWVRFDPTPRNDEINPSTFGLAETELGFSLTAYLDVPDPEPLDFQVTPPRFPEFGEDGPLPVFSGGGESTSSGGLSIPRWVTTIAPWALLFLLIIGTLPTVKWWRRRRRMKRLEEGDITAAWEDIVDRLTDLGERPSPATTPCQLAMSVDNVMMPLATVYGRSVYGPDGSIDDEHIAAATSSLDQTRARLTTRHSLSQRIAAVYRPTSIVPDRAKRAARFLRANGRNGRSNDNGS
jgi:hypothetical protein